MKTMIIGSGVSGYAIYDYLIKEGLDCYFANSSELNFDDLDEKQIDKRLENVKQIIVSPGVMMNKNTVFQIKKRNIALFGELEFAVRKIKNDVIAVTGTNGKTTTVSMINFLLKDFSGGVRLGGNVGIPATSLINELCGSEIVVLECSSFQLETIQKFKPHIAVILNIGEDHLNRHKTMKEYVRCKYKITKNQTTSDYLLLNADDEYIRRNPPKTNAQIFYFSTKRRVLGVYLKKNYIYFYDGVKDVRLVSISNIKLRGEHNLSNILASVLSVYLETYNCDLLKNVSGFNSDTHRIEYVKTVNGVEFYNDSKSTNILSSLAACECFSKKINLILGGSDKGLNFDELFRKIPKNVHRIAVFGEIKNKIALSIKKFNFSNYCIFDTLDDCVKWLFENALPGEVVLLSPACASFDQFSNYEERGNVFKNIVSKL